MLATEVLEKWDGRVSPKRMRKELRAVYKAKARKTSPSSTRRIWYQEIACAFMCRGARSIPDTRRRMKQLGFPIVSFQPTIDAPRKWGKLK